MSSSVFVLVALTIVALLGASAGVVAKILLIIFPPFPLAFLRFLIASITILPFFLKEKQPIQKFLRKELLLLSLLSTANITFFYLGLTKTTANAAVIIYAATPIIVAILSHIFLKEHLTPRKIGGICLGFIGVITIVAIPLLEKGEVLSGNFEGNLLVLIATLSWSLYTLGSRYLIDKRYYSPLTITSISIIVSCVIFAFVSYVFFPDNYLIRLVEIKNLVLMLYLAIMVTVVMYFLYQWAIKHSSATTTSLVTYLQPMIGVWLAVVILDEAVTIGFIVGSLLVIGGVFLATGTQLVNEVKKLRSYIK